MSLATSCGYPFDYFTNLDAISGEDIEVYRNDVVDFLRSVNGSEDGGSTSNMTGSLQPLEITILLR